MQILALIVCFLVLGSLAGCGGDAEAGELSPSVLRKRVGVQFTLGEGKETPQGKALIRTFPQGSLVSCWGEGTDRVCGVAAPRFYAGGLSFSRSFDYWTFYRAVFEGDGGDPEIEEVDPEEALSPSRRKG